MVHPAVQSAEGLVAVWMESRRTGGYSVAAVCAGVLQYDVLL